MSQYIYTIDGKKWMSEAGKSNNSYDGFLYASCYVVAKGKNFYDLVLKKPDVMHKSEDRWAEFLLYVAAQTWVKVTDNDEEEFEEKSSVSYETGSNKVQWSNI